MSKESTQELRWRLLRDPGVQDMIRVRAFEIYERNGRAQGRDAENWLQAEQEVLSFLIEEEDRRASEVRRSVNTTATVSESESSALGAWSATEPASEELAPPIGEATGTGVDQPAPKKTRARASSKSGATKKKSESAGAKEATAKPARRAPAKESGGAKPKTSRKQTKAEGDTQ